MPFDASRRCAADVLRLILLAFALARPDMAGAVRKILDGYC